MIFSVVFKIVVFQSAKLNSHFVGKILSQKLGWIIEKEVLIKSYFPSLHLLHFLFCCKIDILLKKKCDMQSYVFPSDMMFSINKSKYLERKIWLEVELLFSFRLMFSERSLVRIDSHEWTLNLPQNMIFQINSETTLARRWCNTWERWLLWTAYCLLLFEPLVKKATLVFVDQQKKID